MTDWFRSWHGAPTDQKWRLIARRASVRPGEVWAVVSYLWDRASQADDRGSVAGYDCELIAEVFGYEAGEVERIIGALTDKGVIVANRIAAWEKYQPKREDGAAERAKAWREQNQSHKNETAASRTQPNATERNRTLDTETDKKQISPSSLRSDGERAKRAARLPDDWSLPVEWRQDAIDAGLAPDRIDAEAAKMRDWSRSAPHGAKLDWRASWRNWCRRQAEAAPQARGSPKKMKLADGFKAFAEYDNATGRSEDFGAARPALPHLSVVPD